MAEITRVPLQPIEKGSLLKFWLGMFVGIVLAGSIAWFSTRPVSVSVETITAGEGPSPTEDDIVFIDYTGRLSDGTVFDQSQPAAPAPVEIAHLIPEGQFMPLNGVVPGFRDGLMQMQKGGTYTIEIPAELAYGDAPPQGSPIGPGADLIFDVTLHDFMSMEEVQQRGAQIEMIMAQTQLTEPAE